MKKYDDGTVDKSKGVKGRTSKKAKEDQLEYARGYRRGLTEAKKNFNVRGDAKNEGTLGKIGEKFEEVTNKTFGREKRNKGYKKGLEDMDKALKGQGAYKKGGKINMKKGGMLKKRKRDGICKKGKTRGRMV